MTTVYIRVDMGTVHNVPDAAEFARRLICAKIQEQGYNASIIRVEEPSEIRKLGV